MDTKTFKTPNNYTVVIKNDLNYGQYEDIQAIMGENIKLDPATGMPTSVDFKLIGQANKKALDYLLVSIEKDGVAYTGSIRDLPSKDGKAIMAEIDIIMKATANENAEEDKKKVTS